MADETTDKTNKEQVTLVLRWMDDSNFEVHEEFIGLYEVESITSDSIVSVVKDTLIRLNLSLSKARGQCYDGASNMSGIRNGVAIQLCKEEPRAVYTHCYGHALNLAVSDAIKELAETVLRISDNLSKTLQHKEYSAAEGQEISSLTVKTLESIRNESSFDMLWDKIELRRQALEVDPPVIGRKNFVLALPDFALALPDFALALPDFALALPDFALALPDFALALPDFALALPDFALALPDFAFTAIFFLPQHRHSRASFPTLRNNPPLSRSAWLRHYSRLPTPHLHCASAKDGRALKIVNDIGQYWPQPVSFSAVRKDIVEVVK
eukprot:Em0054g4a